MMLIPSAFFQRLSPQHGEHLTFSGKGGKGKKSENDSSEAAMKRLSKNVQDFGTNGPKIAKHTMREEMRGHRRRSRANKAEEAKRQKPEPPALLAPGDLLSTTTPALGGGIRVVKVSGASSLGRRFLSFRA